MKPEDPLAPAVEAFRKGAIIAYPTETFYGLGADPFNEKAVSRLFLLKKRPPDKPVSIIIKDRTMLEDMVEEIPRVSEGLMKKYWPGPLSIIFRAKGLSAALTAGKGKIALRISSNPIAQRLVSELSSPITATSANPSGKPPAASGADVINYFDGGIDVLIDAGELFSKTKKGSTIIDVTENKIVIIREGEIPAKELAKGLKRPSGY